jgi:hypothetical protein
MIDPERYVAALRFAVGRRTSILDATGSSSPNSARKAILEKRRSPAER